MKKNLGTIDRILRLLLAGTLTVLYFTQLISGPAAVALVIATVILAATSFMSFCPLYVPFGLSTRKKS
jgi:hypothetical protein